MSGGRIQHLDHVERQQLSGMALEARWGAQHTIVPKHICRLCGHNRKQTRFFSKLLNEELRKVHCLPAWGESHDPIIYYVIRDGIARELSDAERQQLKGRKNYNYPECDKQGCPNFGKLMVQPRSQLCFRLDGASGHQVEVVTFECPDRASGSKHLHSVHILQPEGYLLEKIGQRGSRYRGVDPSGRKINTVPLTAKHPLTRKPVDAEASKAWSDAHKWDIEDHPKLQNSINALKPKKVQEKRLANMLAATKGAKYPHRGPLNISPEERKRRSDDAKTWNNETLKNRAIVESLGRPRKEDERDEARRLKAQGKSLEQIRIKMKKGSVGAVRNLLRPGCSRPRRRSQIRPITG